jgi:uncharacterized protein YceK
MAFRAIWVALLLSTLPSAGCGTVVNLVRQRPEQGGVSPFGGVRQDVSGIEKAANGESGFWTHPKSESKQHAQVVPMLLWAADLPLSFIGDVVTWPYTAAYTFINQPIPVPPVTPAQPIPGVPGTQAPGEVRPQNSSPELMPPGYLPESRQLP